MNHSFQSLQEELLATPRTWLITGVAGFIGSNLLEALLRLNQTVRGLDNFSTGHRENLSEVQSLVTPEQWSRFEFIEGDIRDLATCQRACQEVDFILHQAALGSVPRSLEDPLNSHHSNVTGFLQILTAARDARVQRMVYAASSSTYGDHPALPKEEEQIGNPLSPYAVTKYVNELYADVYARCYGFSSVGLRYFNVFGPRQDPEGAYAAVIPQWVSSLIRNQPVYVNGDGETSRDFCFIANVIQANLLAATASLPQAHRVYNVAVGERTSLNQLYASLLRELQPRFPHLEQAQATYRDFRPGDVRHSLASIERIQEELGYRPSHRIQEGLGLAMDWYVKRLSPELADSSS